MKATFADRIKGLFVIIYSYKNYLFFTLIIFYHQQAKDLRMNAEMVTNVGVLHPLPPNANKSKVTKMKI